MPEVSIIVPVYNAAADAGDGRTRIERLIDSVLKQDYTDYELILVDDGSTDGSGEILDRTADRDSRIRVVHKKNGGVSNTRNKGLDIAKGTYIQFMDADDYLTKDSTRELVHTAKRTGADLVVGDFYRVVGRNVSRKGYIYTNEPMSLQEYASYMQENPADYYYGVLWNKLYKKSIIDQYHLRMDEKLKFSEDFIFNLEYLVHCKVIAAVQVPVYYYVRTEGSLVSQGMNPLSLYQMKTTVYRYYQQFFKNVLDEKEYNRQRPEIARYLVSAATDDPAIPLMPNTVRLGKEGVHALYDGADDSLLTAHYALGKLLERSMKNLAMNNDLDEDDIKILAAMYAYERSASAREIADYTGISETNVMVHLQSLRLKDLIHEKITADGIEVQPADQADAICGQIKEEMKDLQERLLRGFSDKEKAEASDFYERILDNLKAAVQ